MASHSLISLACAAFLVLTLTTNKSSGSQSAWRNCPSKCHCVYGRRMVTCAKKHMASIPVGIPHDARKINLNGNAFESHRLSRSNLSVFTNVEHLYLAQCSLTAIDTDAFVDLNNLSVLDLSGNDITEIQDGTFYGLHVNVLDLSRNGGIRLDPNAFQGITVKVLFLEECSITTIEPQLLIPLKGSHLMLNKNEITELPLSLKQAFSDLAFVELHNNPLRCDCNMNWLKELYDKDPEKFLRQPPTCVSPIKNQDNTFAELTTDDFTCTTSIQQLIFRALM